MSLGPCGSFIPGATGPCPPVTAWLWWLAWNWLKAPCPRTIGHDIRPGPTVVVLDGFADSASSKGRYLTCAWYPWSPYCHRRSSPRVRSRRTVGFGEGSAPLPVPSAVVPEPAARTATATPKVLESRDRLPGTLARPMATSATADRWRCLGRGHGERHRRRCTFTPPGVLVGRYDEFVDALDFGINSTWNGCAGICMPANTFRPPTQPTPHNPQPELGTFLRSRRFEIEAPDGTYLNDRGGRFRADCAPSSSGQPPLPCSVLRTQSAPSTGHSDVEEGVAPIRKGDGQVRGGLLGFAVLAER